jgi:molecular chaperone GrpE
VSEKPRAAGSAESGPAAGGAASAGELAGSPAERVVIRDKRKINPGGKGKPAAAGNPGMRPAESPPAAQAQEPAVEGAAPASAEPAAVVEPAMSAAPTGEASAEASAGEASAGEASAGEAPAGEAPPTPTTGEPAEGPPAASSVVAEESATQTPADQGEETAGTAEPPTDGDEAPADALPVTSLGAELEALRAELEERTRDLQRVTAEYANYRKRVDRDRGLAAEQTTGAVLAALLPVLDDLDRARDHGDLVGPFGAVAEQLTATLTKLGLTPFGEKGDPFDPTRHEAVAHSTSPEVAEPTCIDVMRRGYLLGDRLLRPAMVAVADPE